VQTQSKSQILTAACQLHQPWILLKTSTIETYISIHTMMGIEHSKYCIDVKGAPHHTCF
jgi:hypothetical protein